jgi:hypothetical protein
MTREAPSELTCTKKRDAVINGCTRCMCLALPFVTQCPLSFITFFQNTLFLHLCVFSDYREINAHLSNVVTNTCSVITKLFHRIDLNLFGTL